MLLRAVCLTYMMARKSKPKRCGAGGLLQFTPAPPPPKRKLDGRRRRRRGVELIEFTLVLLPLMGFIFLLVDLGWAIYKNATMQFAVREGCRYAVTNQVQALTDSNGKAY